jgi:hypothetical protein
MVLSSVLFAGREGAGEDAAVPDKDSGALRAFLLDLAGQTSQTRQSTAARAAVAMM